MTDGRADWVKGVAHWREGDTALISVAFTWRLPEARRLAEYYRAIGCTKIRIGGPGTFTQRKYLADIDAEIGGSIPTRSRGTIQTPHGRATGARSAAGSASCRRWMARRSR
jgi:hypothetical protein